VRGGVGEGKSSHCQCQAADDDPSGDRGDCESPNATEKEETSLRIAEGQYFGRLTWSLTLYGFLRVHGRKIRRLAAWWP
jgi:hypothetical protein